MTGNRIDNPTDDPADNPTNERHAWQRVREIIGRESITLPPRASLTFRQDPTVLVELLSACKFAAKMIGQGRTILELGCGEGVGVPILAEHATRYLGIDADHASIQAATRAWANAQVTFQCGHPQADRFGVFDAAVCLDLPPDDVAQDIGSILDAMAEQVESHGLVIAGASSGAVTMSRLLAAFHVRFHNVLPFFTHGQLVHAGVSAAIDHAIIVACNRKPSHPA